MKAFVILPDLLRQFGGTKKELAKAIGVTQSAISRLPHTPPSVEVALRLARATGANPDRVLRAAGRADMADLLEQLYGHVARQSKPPRPGRHITPKQSHVLDAIAALPPATQRALHVLIEFLTTPKTKPNGKRLRKIA